MSVKLSSYVWDGCAASGIKDTKLLVMVRLADWCNDDGVCWPSVETISRQTGAGISTVRTAIGELEKLGWLSRKQRRIGNRNASNVYHLNVAKLRDSAARAQAPVSDPSKSERSESDASEFDGSKSDASKSGKNNQFDPPESGGDPLVNSKHDPSDKKTLCQPPADADPEVVLTDSAKEVLAHLNMVTGSRYQVSKSSLENIRARLGEGFETGELILTVDYLNAKWSGDLDMAEYLRPATLFQPTKFPGYLSGAQSWLKAGRPKCVNGKWVKEGGEVIGGDSVDVTERDAAYRRFIGSGRPLKNPSQLELTVKAEASKAGVRGMRADFAVSRWNSIWKECARRTAGGKAA
ncbi:conserved phage C-terminal domain-containing protein [Erwinia sp. Leaf53]|uniref:conserved phage C-terminal domain-containing protein n=1 Tax=Erwinia sp. Leaf53 TaxID=1736225 RepID=UPI0006FEBF04|nr:conserved phage C-terminal domain-containing protein [Erwinia sp. Leaf53]KQN56748.1 GntR family transcriptional regulator [Erwinia sp. Leaf53]